jgi:hypothetical protein
MAFRWEILGQTLEAIDAELELFAQLIRPVMDVSPQPVEVIVSNFDKFAFVDLLDVTRERFNPEGYEVTFARQSVCATEH